MRAGADITADKLEDPGGNFVATAETMGPGGGWDTKPFHIVGQESTCGNSSVVKWNSNPSAVILPSGVVVLAYRATLTTGSESINIAVSQNTSGPFEAVFPCGATMPMPTWGEYVALLPSCESEWAVQYSILIRGCAR